MSENLRKLPLNELRLMWVEAWGREPHARIGRTMLEKSLTFKLREREGQGLTPEQQARLNRLVREYKRNPACFESRGSTLKPGTRLVRMHEGKKHSVLIRVDGFEYNGRIYNSLSQIANDITGKRWNGWVFFGLKKAGAQ